MLQFKRIAGFLAIGFILVFVAKIDKMGLFSVYFKTIAEVEVRNSQQVQEHVADVQISELSNAGNVQHPQVDAIWANLAEIVPCVGLGRLDWPMPDLNQDLDTQQEWMFLVMPRAPGLVV